MDQTEHASGKTPRKGRLSKIHRHNALSPLQRPSRYLFLFLFLQDSDRIESVEIKVDSVEIKVAPVSERRIDINKECETAHSITAPVVIELVHECSELDKDPLEELIKHMEMFVDPALDTKDADIIHDTINSFFLVLDKLRTQVTAQLPGEQKEELLWRLNMAERYGTLLRRDEKLDKDSLLQMLKSLRM